MTKQGAIPPERLAQEASRWYVEEADGATLLMTNHLDDPVLVEWDEDHGGWECGTCGSFSVKAQAPATCPHVQAAGRRLPVPQALNMVTRVMNKCTRRTSVADGVAHDTEVPAERVEVGAEKRAERAAVHDAGFVAATPVVVRQMTAEDKAKLDAARARKARAYETPDRPNWSHR